jgi:uncharacterized protein
MSGPFREGPYREPEPPFKLGDVDFSALASRIKWGFLLLAVLVILLSLGWLRTFYTDYLWFQEVGYESVLLTVISTRIWLFLITFLVVLALALPNIYLVYRHDRSLPYYSSVILQPQAYRLARNILFWLASGLVALGALLFAGTVAAEWETILRFFHGVPFGAQDPEFNRDLSFYMFTLPVLNLVRDWFLFLVVGIMILVAGLYYANRTIRGETFLLRGQARAHLFSLGAVFFLLLGAGQWLARYELLYSPHGSVFGIGYTEAFAMLPARTLLAVAAIVVAIFLLVSIRSSSNRPAYWAAGLWLALLIVAGSIFPAVVQRFQVEPSEMAREEPYLANNIRMTRQAYGLNRIVSRSHPARGEVDIQTIEGNPGTLQNIRLWDEGPLLQSYNQIQFFRLYYDFISVSTDRYLVDDSLRQVMLAARELSAEKLPQEAQRWVNRHLQFTHGYGVAMTPVTEVSPGGRPAFFVSDVPPRGRIPLERPEIYYGLKSLDFLIVRSRMQEFNYPGPDGPVYTHYAGTGGIPLSSFVRRLIYAWQFRDLNILISGEVQPESRIQYRRTVPERFSTVAPFLMRDRNPYLVVADGRLFWIQDAYTVSRSFPYSTPWQGRLNYIRNSVKAVVDAYNGSIDYYISDPEDPLIQTYAAMFPGLFRPMSELPEYLESHIRYPEDFFSIQTQMLLQYHMEDPVVFYNKEDQWSLPVQTSFGRSQLLTPYYIVARLPDRDREEFLLLQPLTPNNRHNLVSWIAARSDPPHYGELVLYRFPAGRHVDGPNQVEARIDNDAVISEQFTLWGQVGSEVSRGILLVVPVGDSILYAEPVFLRPETLNFPELRRIILADANAVVMHTTLDNAVLALVGQAPAVAPIMDRVRAEASPPEDLPAAPPPPPPRRPDDMEAVRQGLEEAVARLQEVIETLRRMNP